MVYILQIKYAILQNQLCCHRKLELLGLAQHISDTGHSIKAENLKIMEKVASSIEFDGHVSFYMNREFNNPLNSEYAALHDSVFIDLLG